MFQKHIKPSGNIVEKTFLYNGSIRKIDADIQAVINVKPEKRSEIHTNGMSSVSLQVHTDKVKLVAAGMSKIKLTGSADEVSIKSSGMSETDTRDMAAKSVSVACSGMCKTKVYAEKKLKGTGSGMSSVTYWGKDVSVSIANSGMSTVTKGESGNG